jgi:hypothetical protein
VPAHGDLRVALERPARGDARLEVCRRDARHRRDAAVDAKRPPVPLVQRRQIGNFESARDVDPPPVRAQVTAQGPVRNVAVPNVDARFHPRCRLIHLWVGVDWLVIGW